MTERDYKDGAHAIGKATDKSDPLRDTFHKLESAEALRLKRQLDRARTICEGLIKKYPDYFGALYTLGLVYIDAGQFPQALGCLVRAAMLNPQSWKALTALSAVYLELDASEMAAQALEQASQINPDDPSILLTLGEIYHAEREYELAGEAYQRCFELDPGLHAAALGLGACHEHLGQYAEAADVFESLYKGGMRSVSIFGELNNLPSSFVSIDLLSNLKNVKREPKQDKTDFATSVAFVSAAVLHEAGRHEKAWKHLVDANKAIHASKLESGESLARMQQTNLAQLKEKQLSPRGDVEDETSTISLFILGPSRSGKTTLESLVATLDGVKRGYENPSVENAIRRAFQSAGLLTTRLFEVLPPELDGSCRELYLKELAKRAGTARVFTNTHPGRIHDAARVATAFPNVRFIFVKRDIEDNMLRIYMRKYHTGNSYAYDLKSIHDHIIWYHEIMDVLAERLPEIARVVRYEDMVTNPAGTLGVAAELCGLEMTGGPLPQIGDDRGCSEPYRILMADAR